MASSIRELSAIAKKQLALRDQIWPGQEPYLWHRKTHNGYATIPKTMPLILKIMDEMTKGTPVSSTYLALWCGTWDNSFVTLSKPAEMANAAGFSGQRGERTWASRVQLLNKLHFINVKPGPSGSINYVLMMNPHLVIRHHHENKTPGLVEASYHALIERALEVGAVDMLDQPAAAAS
jgi:hypothetical protein